MTGLKGFSLVWAGQIVSLLGTAMTGFGVTIWAYERTGSATALALVAFFFVTPMLIISPLAGALVDRSNRKLMMALSDLASGVTTIAILALYASGRLEVWHLYITGAIEGAFQAFQWPAFSAAITTMLPKEQYGRANGMMSLADAGSAIFAPILAGALIGPLGLGGILVIDIVTFVVAVLALLFVVVPQPAATAEGIEGKGSLWQESLFGFRYIFQRPSLLGLQLIFMAGNLVSGIANTVVAPAVLARTGNNELIFATFSSVSAVGAVAGGVLMSVWGGPKRRVHGVLSGWILASLLGYVVFGITRSPVMWAAAGFAAFFFGPIINGSSQAIWQAKVAPDVQGRVFSTRRLIAWFSTPLAALIAGPLADVVLEPAMRQESVMSSLFGPLVGTGPGAGMALMFVFSGIGCAAIGLAGYLVRVVREAETILPDYDSSAAQPAAGSAVAAATD